MLAPGISVSSTICCLSAQLQRRRRSTVITSARCIVLEVRLSLLLERGHARHRRSRRPHRAVTRQRLEAIYVRLAGLPAYKAPAMMALLIAFVSAVLGSLGIEGFRRHFPRASRS